MTSAAHGGPPDLVNVLGPIRLGRSRSEFPQEESSC